MRPVFRHGLALALLALGVVLVLGRPSRAETPRLEVTGTPVKAEVPLGQDIEVEVQVKNVGAAEADLPELTFDARSVSFEVSCEGGKPAWDAQYHVDPPRSSVETDPLTPIKRSKLKAGEAWKKVFTIPAIAVGSFSITAVYGGTTEPEPRALSLLAPPDRILKVKDASARSVRVLPGPNGETELRCKMTTTLGTFALKFFPKEALGSALNFVRIAAKGGYEGTCFFRNSAELDVLQGGAANASAHFEWTIPRELNLKHAPLMVAMARGNPANSGGAQFYIAYGPKCTNLDRADGYAVFAQVVKGKDVIETMASARTRGGPGPLGEAPTTPINIESVKIQLAPKE